MPVTEFTEHWKNKTYMLKLGNHPLPPPNFRDQKLETHRV